MGSRKVVLITGCSSPQGIGFASARALAQVGHAVHATVRHHDNDAALAEGLAEAPRVHDLELTDRAAVTAVIDAGFAPPGIGYYIASKAALEIASQSLATEVAPWGINVTNFQPGPVMTELERVWGHRLRGDDDPRPELTDELYAWVQTAGPEPQSPAQVADALVDLIADEDPPLAAQSGPASEEYVATALRDPSRRSELAAMLAAFAPPRSAPPPGETTAASTGS